MTVEMTLLMPLILALLIGILIVGFYLHDKACLQGAACESSAWGSCLAVYEDGKGKTEKMAASLMKSRLMWGTGAGGSVTVGNDQALASYQAGFRFPGIVGLLWFSSDGQIQAESSRKIFHAAGSIRKLLGVKYVAKTLRG